MINYILAILNVKTTDKENMDIQMAVVEQFIVENYGQLTTEEIKKAFKMYVNRELGNTEVYRLFDCAAVGEVLSKFVQIKAETLQVYHRKKQIPASVPMSETEKKEIHKQFLKMVFDELVSDGYSEASWILYNEIKPKLSVRKPVLIRLFRMQVHLQSRVVNTNPYRNQIMGSVENKCRSIVVSNYLKKHLSDFQTFKKAIQ